MYWDYCSLFIKTTKVSLCCEVCHFTTPLYTWASPRLCGCWFSWCAPSTTAPPAGFAVQGSPVSVPHCGCWELFPPVSIAGPCSGDWTRKGWHQTLSLYDFHSSHQLQPGLHGACKHHAQESRSLWAFYFSSVQDEIWLANKKKQNHKNMLQSQARGLSLFFFFFCTSWCINIWIRCDMVPFHPCNLVTNKLSLKQNAEWTWLWHKMHTHTNMSHAHTHPCMHPHPHRHTHSQRGFVLAECSLQRLV